MSKRSVGFKIGVVLAIIHLVFAALVLIPIMDLKSACRMVMGMTPLMLLDGPLMFLGMFIHNPFILYGLVGTLMWFLVPVLMDKIIRALFPRVSAMLTATIIIALLPVVVYASKQALFLNTKIFMYFERPKELRNSGGNASSQLLTERVIFNEADIAGEGVLKKGPGGEYRERHLIGNARHIMKGRFNPAGEMEIALSGLRSVAFFDENLGFKSRKEFDEVATDRALVDVDGDGVCEYLAYEHMTSVSLLSHDGSTIWKYSGDKEKHEYLDGVAVGDMDGDGKPQFAAYYTYGRGVVLLNESGVVQWEHPVVSLGTLEMSDVDGDGKSEIVYDNSNNANGITEFTVLNDTGGVKGYFKASTKSSHFAIAPWPDRAGSQHVFISEDGRILVYDMKGQPVSQLDATGNKAYGDFKLLYVKIKSGDEDYLAIKKNVMPDLSVLYVYSPQKQLIYQKTDVVRGLSSPVLFSLPVGTTGAERLIATAESDRYEALLREYTPSGK